MDIVLEILASIYLKFCKEKKKIIPEKELQISLINLYS